MAASKEVAAAPSSSGPSVDPEQTLKASKALLAFMKKAAADKPDDAKKNLLADDDEESIAETPIWLTLTTKKHIRDTARLKPGKIILPHPLNTDTESTVCLITADPQRAYKDIVASNEFPEELRARITRVIDVAHIKSKFRSYEAQRKLFSEHDIFLADDRVINRLPQALGKTFFKTTIKRPIPVVLQAGREKVDGKRAPRPKGKGKRDPATELNVRSTDKLAAEIEKAIGAALVNLTPSTNTAVRIGTAELSAEQLALNIQTAANELVERFVPQKWNNVRAIFIKGPKTAALPIWETDELWTDDAKVVPDSEANDETTAGSKSKSKSKRKSVVDVEVKEEPAKKKRKSFL